MRIGKIAGTWFPLIVLAAGALAVFLPTPFLPLGSLITPLLMIIMLGMGMTLQASDFAMVVKRPYALIIGMLAQYLIMPATAWLVVTILDLTPAIAVGVILVSAAPGGTASNVMTYLAKGDIALSVSMTTVVTSPGATCGRVRTAVTVTSGQPPVTGRAVNAWVRGA